MGSWIKLYHKFKDWEWYANSHMVHLFIHLIISANWEDCDWKGITIRRGQVIAGREKLSKETGISEQSIRTCLNRLKSTSEITIKSTNKYSIITICNYEQYQPKDNQTNQQTPNKRPTTNHNNRIIDIKDNIYADFEVFWDRYHEVTGLGKTDKEPTLKHWNKLTAAERQKAVSNISAFFNSLSDAKYCKKARTYLSDKSFNDEFKSATPEIDALNLL